jgi:MATE family multidrug resistance protein
MVRDVAGMAGMVMLAQALPAIGAFINALMLARVSGHVFAASMITSSVQLTIMTVSTALLFALGAMFSRVLGDGMDPTRIGRIFSAGLVIGLLIALANMLLFWNMGRVLHLLRQPESLVVLCDAFFRVALWSVPASACLAVYNQFLLGTFNQRAALAFSVFSLAFNASCNYVLIFGKLGLPALGLQGLAWSSVVSSGATFLVLTLYITQNPKHREYCLVQFGLAGLRRSLGLILKIGVPICIQVGNELFAFFATTIMVGWMGAESLEAKQVTTRYLMLLVIPIFGISQASTVLVGRQFGAQDLHLAKSYANVCVALGLAYTLLTLLTFAVMPQPFIRIFLGDTTRGELMHLIAQLLVIAALGQVFDSVRNVITGALRGLQVTKAPMLVGLVSVWLFAVPLSYVMGFTWKMGLPGMAWAHTIAMAASATVLYLHWNHVIGLAVQPDGNEVSS